jgi:hypothetical protein
VEAAEAEKAASSAARHMVHDESWYMMTVVVQLTIMNGE